MSDTGVRTRLRELAAEEIRVHLARRRMSASELARRTGMKQSTLARRMTGATAFDLDDLERIADVLGVQVADLLPRRDTANTLWNQPSAKRPRSAGKSTVRATRTTARPPTRPGGGTPKADTRRPAMIRRTLPV